MIKVGGIEKNQVLWQAVFLAASPLAMSGSAAKMLFQYNTKPPATQASPSVESRPQGKALKDLQVLADTFLTIYLLF